MTLVQTLGAAIATPESTAVLNKLQNIRVGRLQLEDSGRPTPADIATYRKLYNDAVSVAGTLWDSAKTRWHARSLRRAVSIVNSLAAGGRAEPDGAAGADALKNYDSYTFTHMVNVSILTMGQARGLGIDGPLLREFGLSALLHDIGKVKTPSEILNKPEKLTDKEFEILGAILSTARRSCGARPKSRRWRRSSRSSITCALDGTGYPFGVSRPDAQPRHHAVRNRGRLRCDAVAARLPGSVSDRPHPRGAAAERRQAVRSASRAAVLAAGRHLSRRATWSV